jgi:hypothetical protein
VLATVRAIKQNLQQYAIQAMFAVGPFSILFMEGKSGSPFNIREAVPVHFFTAAEVATLLGQFANARGVSLEEGIAADVFELTAGHAGLVCACGRALESRSKVPRPEAGHISLAAWRDFRARGIVDEVMSWPTVGKMARALFTIPPDVLPVLHKMLAVGDAPLMLADDAAQAATYLAAEGWLVSVGDFSRNVFRVTSPLVRNIALHQLAKRRAPLAEPLPLDAAGDLVVPVAVATALRYFRRDTMLAAAAVSTQLSRATIAGSRVGKPVPSEAAYHFQLFAVLRSWLNTLDHALLFAEADSRQSADGSGSFPRKQYADMLLIGRAAGAPKHVLELVASADNADVCAHFARSLSYMAAQNARGTCITFTALPTAADVEAVAPASLPWPTSEQLTTGLEAIHVLHDLAWTRAAVHAKRALTDMPPVSVVL